MGKFLSDFTKITQQALISKIKTFPFPSLWSKQSMPNQHPNLKWQSQSSETQQNIFLSILLSFTIQKKYLGMQCTDCNKERVCTTTKRCENALTRPANTLGYLCREFPATGLPDLTKLKPTQYTCKVAVCHHSMSEADTLIWAFRFPPSEPTKCIKICWFPLCVLSSICHNCKIKDYSVCPFGFPKPRNIIPHLKGHSTNKNPILPEFVCLLLLAITKSLFSRKSVFVLLPFIKLFLLEKLTKISANAPAHGKHIWET